MADENIPNAGPAPPSSGNRPDVASSAMGWRRPRDTSARMIFGGIIMLLGVLWTLDNLGLADSGAVLRWWPLLLVMAGVWRLAGVGGMPRQVSGAVLTLIGLLLLADTLNLFDVDVWDVWPVVLILIGFGLVTRRWSPGPRVGAVPGGDPGDHIEAFAFWSGVDRKPTSRGFRGGDVTAVMGGAEIDLRSAEPVAEGAVLDLFVWMGGVEVHVPKDWRVVNEGTAIMGAFEDTREAPPLDAVKTLRLRGFVLMGGVEVKN